MVANFTKSCFLTFYLIPLSFGISRKFKILVDFDSFWIVSQLSIRFHLKDGTGRSDCDSFSSDFFVWDFILDDFLQNSWFLEVPWGSLKFPPMGSAWALHIPAWMACLHMRARTCMHAFAYACICMHMHAYACLHMHACIRMHACMHAYAFFFIINQKRRGATFDTKQVLKLCCNG